MIFSPVFNPLNFYPKEHPKFSFHHQSMKPDYGTASLAFHWADAAK